jgi:hypothetical protein
VALLLIEVDLFGSEDKPKRRKKLKVMLLFDFPIVHLREHLKKSTDELALDRC